MNPIKKSEFPVFADPVTRLDLGLFEAPGKGKFPSVFSLLDHTLTARGKQLLREFLEKPSSDPVEIRKRQETLRLFIRNISLWEKPLLTALGTLDPVEKYIRSNYQTQKPHALNRLNFFIQYHFQNSAMTRFIKTGIDLTAFLLDQAILLAESSPNAPDLLNVDLSELKKLRDLAAGQRKHKAPLEADLELREKQSLFFTTLFEALYRMEVYYSLAKSIAGLGWNFPEFQEQASPVFRAEGLYHPLIEGAVENDFELGIISNVAVITGPNMAGKSTFIRACGIAAYLAHTGMAVPAAKLFLTPFSGIAALINVSDDMTRGHSYYYAEISRLREIAEMAASEKPFLIIIDEALKGTNLKDAYDGLMLLFQGFRNFQKSLFMTTTHIVECVRELSKKDRYQTHYFDGEFENDFRFSYRLKEGISDCRIGYHLLEKIGLTRLLNPGSLTPAPSAPQENPRG